MGYKVPIRVQTLNPKPCAFPISHYSNIIVSNFDDFYFYFVGIFLKKFP